MKAFVVVVLSSLLGLALVLDLTGSTAFAQAGDVATTVALGPATPTSVKGRLGLSARLTTADGKPLSGQPVVFSLDTDLLGKREAALGSATTDSTGLAALSYQPAQTGLQTVRARFAGGAGFAASETSADVQVKEVVPTLREEPLPFAGLRDWLPAGLVALVIGVWVVLLGVFLATVRGIRRAAQV